MLLARALCRSHNFGTLHGPMHSADETDCVQVFLYRSHATSVSLQFSQLSGVAVLCLRPLQKATCCFESHHLACMHSPSAFCLLRLLALRVAAGPLLIHQQSYRPKHS